MSHINLNTLEELKKTGNGSAFVKQIIDVFIKDTPTLLQNIDKGFQSKTAETLRSAVHKYKSSSRSVGALGLSQLCLEVEKMAQANQHNSPNATQKIQQIKTIAGQVIDELKIIKTKI
jgi:HPt (histidine-containing phosphotransfer) domain-containing protein